jgi:hypothetical protein
MNVSALKHQPMRPPRANHLGEQVYSSMWEALMTTPPVLSGDPWPVEVVLSDYEWGIGEREAIVLASVVCWLGTNCGLAMLQQADNDEAGRPASFGAHYRYLRAWARENYRRQSTNCGVKTIENCLAPAEAFHSAPLHVRSIWPLPELSARDLEVADHLMVWLGDDETGQAFLRQCEAEVKRLMEEHSLAERARFLRENWTAKKE